MSTAEGNVMDMLAKIAEQRIREAMERGEFDHLPLQGQPIPLEDLSGVPEALRMGYKILLNAGVLPEEMQLKKDVVSLQQLLDACDDPAEHASLRHRLNEKTLRYNMMMERRHRTPTLRHYRAKILRKLGV
jgi:hypothetical protein